MAYEQRLGNLKKELKKLGIRVGRPIRIRPRYQAEVDEFARRVEDIHEKSRNAPPIHFDAALS